MVLEKGNISGSFEEKQKENFQFIIEGIIQEEDNKDYLITPDSRKFRVKRVGSNWSKNVSGFWQVEPSVDNLGQVNNLVVEKQVVEKDFLTEPFSLVIFQGRVVQLSKKAGGVIVKVKRDGKKTLRITLLEATKAIKVSELWEFVAVLKGQFLCIKDARYLQG